jgi:hypothetical protein
LRIDEEDGTMAVDEARRLQLHAAARERLGEAEGDALMNLLPPADTDMATRQDLELHLMMTRHVLEERIAATREELTERIDSGIDSLRTDLTTRIDATRKELTERIDGGIGSLRTDLTTRIDATRKELTERIESGQKELAKLRSTMYKVGTGTVVGTTGLLSLMRLAFG